ncbi:MAG: ATP-grasp domain-containing protein [bacterium]|nr:ATP-grasp domain-containing protein [bacterium]
MNKTVAIYFSPPNVLDYPLSKQIYFEAYAEILEELENQGVTAVIVRADSYLNSGVFSKYTVWNKQKSEYQMVNRKILVDLIWNRDSENTIPKISDCAILNDQEFDDICRDKLKSYKLFSNISAPTFLIHAYASLADTLLKIKTELVVLKPRFGEGSYGVHVLKKNEVTRNLYNSWKNIIVQEFLDSSCGIQGLVVGLHEINIWVVNSKFAGARIKQPLKENLISSAAGASAGTVRGIHQEQIPDDLWEKVLEIDKKVSKYSPRLFRADFVYTKQSEFKLIEINSRPGVMHAKKEGPEYYWDFNGAVVTAVVSYLNRDASA